VGSVDMTTDAEQKQILFQETDSLVVPLRENVGRLRIGLPTTLALVATLRDDKLLRELVTLGG